MCLLDLPDEIIIKIICQLSLIEIYIICQCNNRLYRIWSQNNLWYKIIKNISDATHNLKDILDPKKYCEDNYIPNLDVYYHFSDIKYMNRKNIRYIYSGPAFLSNIKNRCTSYVNNKTDFNYEECIKFYGPGCKPKYYDIVNICYGKMISTIDGPKYTRSKYYNNIKVKDIKQVDIILHCRDLEETIFNCHKLDNTKIYANKLKESNMMKDEVIKKHINPIIKNNQQRLSLKNIKNTLYKTIDKICEKLFTEKDNEKVLHVSDFGFDTLLELKTFQLKYINSMTKNQVDFFEKLNSVILQDIQVVHNKYFGYSIIRKKCNCIVFNSSGNMVFI